MGKKEPEMIYRNVEFEWDQRPHYIHGIKHKIMYLSRRIMYDSISTLNLVGFHGYYGRAANYAIKLKNSILRNFIKIYLKLT